MNAESHIQPDTQFDQLPDQSQAQSHDQSVDKTNQSQPLNSILKALSPKTETNETLPTINQQSTSESQKQFKGLQNQGATCYMNSLLQSLFMTPDFRRMIYKWKYDQTKNPEKKDCIIYQLQKLFAALQAGNLPFAKTNDLTASFQWDYSQSLEQQDVQEFMRVLFDAIEQSFEINDIFGVVEDLYMGTGNDFLRCHQCGYSSQKKTKFYDLQLPVRNEFENITNSSIEQALFGYLRPEILEGANAYQCSGCGQKVTASKGVGLERLPKILTLQLQRFTLDINTWQRKKLNDRVSFPLVLNMNHFLDEQKQQDWSKTEALIKENPLNEVRPTQYRAQCTKAAQKEALESIEKAQKNDTQERFEANVARELGEFDETNVLPSAKGKLTEKRRADQLKQQQEHREKLKALKLKTKAKKKVGGLDKSAINSSFFNNAKSNKDAVQGWAFDFDNPDAGTGSMKQEEDAIMKQVMNESLKETCKSQESANPESIDDQECKSNQQTEKVQDAVDQIKADFDVPNAKVTQEQLLQTVMQKTEELKVKYLQEGNFVYDLYAIMIHSGSAFGGHYYAFIKDLETGQWSNFNDSSVRKITLVELVEMFGPEPTLKKGMAAKRMAATHSANAYMLMYRIIDPKEDLANLQLHDDEIPQEVLLDLNSTEVKQKEVQLVQEKKSQMMQLKVIYYPPMQIIDAQNLDDLLETKIFYVDRREDTYSTFFDKVYKEFIKDTTKDRANFRLRAYNVQFKIMLDTYTNRDSDSLEQLKIYPMKTLAFEEKLPTDTFEEYDPNQMVIKINWWRIGIVSLAEDVLKPRQVKVFKDTLMKDFISLLSEQFGIKAENVIVLKRNPMLHTKCMELLSDQPDKKLTQLRINEGVNLFIEDSSVEIPESLNQFNSDDFEVVDPNLPSMQVTKPTKWEKEFELESNRFQVKFNDPKNGADTLCQALTAQQTLDAQNKAYSGFLIVDQRISVLDLKIKVCELFKISLSDLVFRRGGSHGTELLEDELTLKQAQFYNMICLYLEKGIPSQVGQKRLKFFIADYSGITNFGGATIQMDDAAPVALPDHCFFRFEELLEIPLKTAQKVGVLKPQIVKRIDEAFPELGLGMIDLARIRLREKSGEDKLTTVYHGNRELNRYQIYDGKEVAIQVTNEQLIDDLQQEKSYLILVKLWNQEHWTLSESIELFVPKMATLDTFADVLLQQFPHIDRKSILCTKINSSWNFSRVQLPFEQWQQLDGSTDFFQAAPFYVSTDGILFIVKDGSMKERDMTIEERELYRTDDFEANLFAAGTATTGKRTYKESKEKGVTIKVKGASPKNSANEEAFNSGKEQSLVIEAKQIEQAKE